MPFKLAIFIFSFFLIPLLLNFFSPTSSYSISLKNPQPSFLILTVESLGFDNISCSKTFQQKYKLKYFKLFCDESIWFTHAFTPSVMSQAALASLLTGKYPHEHRAWDNGPSFLSEENVTVAEMAFQKGYQTSFFSGGPPIWRKSGFSQGFEIFDDAIPIQYHKYYRPFNKSTQLFLKWLKSSVHKKSFMSFIHIADLQFPHTTTSTNLGETRRKSYESQIEEVSESMNYLFQKLKQHKRWDQTYIILAGLNGKPNQNRIEEMYPYNLHVENTQVTLIIKPIKKKNDHLKTEKINKNVSLVDVGITLYDLLNHKLPSPPIGRKSSLQALSLKSSLHPLGETQKNHQNSPNLLLIESAWPQWRKFGRSRFALRKGPYLFLFNKTIEVYNTLTDRLENIAVAPHDLTDPLFYTEALAFMHNMGFVKWTPLSPSLVHKLKVGRELWQEKKQISSSLKIHLEKLKKTRAQDPHIQGWSAYQALKEKNWKDLKTLGENYHNPFWTFLANAHLKHGTKSPSVPSQRQKTALKHSQHSQHFTSPEFFCQKYFFIPPNSPSPFSSKKLSLTHSLKNCKNKLFILLLSWIYEQNRKKKNLKKESFLREYLRYKTDEKLFQLHQFQLLSWDVRVDFLHQPSLTDLYLSLPSSKKFLHQIQLRLKSIPSLPFP